MHDRGRYQYASKDGNLDIAQLNVINKMRLASVKVSIDVKYLFLPTSACYIREFHYLVYEFLRGIKSANVNIQLKYTLFMKRNSYGYCELRQTSQIIVKIKKSENERSLRTGFMWCWKVGAYNIFVDICTSFKSEHG